MVISIVILHLLKTTVRSGQVVVKKETMTLNRSLYHHGKITIIPRASDCATVRRAREEEEGGQGKKPVQIRRGGGCELEK